ncbi:MAG: hypothetical protein ACKPCM_15430, partial [Pseudanabaena sp.]
MASNRNISPTGQGVNEPNKKQPNQHSLSADAANVDFMSDPITQIGGSQSISTTEKPIESDLDEFRDLDRMIDENFDLAAFDEDFLPEILPTDTNLVPPINLVSDPFEEAINNELFNNNDYDLEVDLYEEALANDLLTNDLLNEYTSDKTAIDKLTTNRTNFAVPLQNSSSPDSFDMELSDQDFLDDFDLDSIDIQLTDTDDEFDSEFAHADMSTGLQTSLPSITPVSPSATNQDVFSSIDSNPNPLSPPPLPFLTPLPPKRNAIPLKPSSPPVPNTGYQSPSEQSRDQNPVSPVDESWS